jgi:hypothetical protein
MISGLIVTLLIDRGTRGAQTKLAKAQRDSVRTGEIYFCMEMQHVLIKATLDKAHLTISALIVR